MLSRRVLLLLLFLCISFAGRAQDDLFGSVSNAPGVKGAFLIGASYDFNKPVGDLAKRFGSVNRLSGSLQYRLPSNWQFGIQGAFLFTSDVKEDSLLSNIKDVSGFYLDNNGQRVGLEIAGRGYQIGLTAGKMIPLSQNNPNSGVLVQLAGGFIQHKIFYYNQQDNFAQLRDDYKKGYDRLTNGVYVEPYVGYQYFSSNSRLFNFHIGVVALMGFTQGRRDWQFDVQRPDKTSRFDAMFGIRAGWYIPVLQEGFRRSLFLMAGGYNLGIALYRAAIWVAQPFVPKAKKAILGRQNGLQHIQQQLAPEIRPRIWMHCASLGEFEQGRPVLEALRKRYPDHALVLTFFSPSGYEVRKDYAGADYIFYLPFDTAGNAPAFVTAVQPQIALFVKYDLWLHYLEALRKRDIPAFLFAARFSRRQGYFKWWGRAQRRMLHLLNGISVQDAKSADLLKTLQLPAQISVDGDPRFDRVLAAAQVAAPLPEVEAFSGGAPLLVAGSTWKEDEDALHAALSALPAQWKIVLVPHEVEETHILRIEKLFAGETARWGTKEIAQKRIVIVNRVGLLLGIYRSATIAYVGGGFSRTGVHNVLEPAAMGAPVLHGPTYHFYLEAQGLLAAGGSVAFADATGLEKALQHWVSNTAARISAGKAAASFVAQGGGATAKIVDRVETLLPANIKTLNPPG